MKIWESALIAVPLMVTGFIPAEAACYFSPYNFFPDRNDQVQIQVTTESGQSCAVAFKEGPGYKFTSASFLRGRRTACWPRPARPNFLYLPFTGYKGPDSCAIKLCAIVQGRSGCSSLSYVVDVR
jgi:hypothetical protein